MNRLGRDETSQHGLRRCSFAEVDHPASKWNRAANATAQGDPVCCRTEWQLSFHETIAPERPLHVIESGGSVIAFAEILDPRLGTLLVPLESSWLFGCPLLGPKAVDLLDEFLRESDSQGEAYSVLISGILVGSPLRRHLAHTLGSRYQGFEIEPVVLCSASLEGGLDGFLSRRSRSLRRNLRQAARRAAQNGVSYERCLPGSAHDADATFARMLAVERTSWKGIGRCGMAEPPSNEFYAAMLRRMSASGSSRVMFARCDGEDIGFIFGSLAEKTYRGQQFSYAEDWSPFSIGNLLQIEQIRWLCEDGILDYHMGPEMDYKQHWTEIETRMDSWVLRPLSA